MCSTLPWCSVASGWWRIVRPLTCGGHWFCGTLDWLRSVSLECLGSYQISYGKVLKLYTVRMYVHMHMYTEYCGVFTWSDWYDWFCCWLAPDAIMLPTTKLFLLKKMPNAPLYKSPGVCQLLWLKNLESFRWHEMNIPLLLAETFSRVCDFVRNNYACCTNSVGRGMNQ